MSCSSDKPQIGGLFGLSGFATFAGEGGHNGFILAIEDSGMDINYVVEDTQSDFTHTITAANKLINVDEVEVVIGPEWIEFGELVSPIAHDEQVLFISTWMDRFEQLVQNMTNEGVQTIALIYSRKEK